MDNISILATEWLDKEYRRVCISLERAAKKYVAPAKEVEDLRRKKEILLYLLQRCY